MKCLLAFASVFALSTSLFAQTIKDYEVVRYEASDYRDWTLEEFAENLGENSALLPQYTCNNRDEWDPFHAPLRINPERDSLRLKAYKTDEIIFYRGGDFFNLDGTRINQTEDVFFNHAKTALHKLENTNSGAKLLRMLEESYFPLTMKLGNFSFNPSIEGGVFWSGIKRAMSIPFILTKRMSDVRPSHPFDDIGVGGDILWHPTGKALAIEDDGVERQTDPAVSLAHEMYHAFDSIRGLLDMGNVQGKDYARESVVEYRAVYMENLVRKELGHRYRKYYSKPVTFRIDEQGRRVEIPLEEIPDVLDENGRPQLIAAPCLVH